MKNGFHLSGIIPVSGNKEGDLKFPWHDSLMPLGNDYLAVERSVVECAYAGCETIWIVCNDDIQPLIRYRLGDYVNDPVWMNRQNYTAFSSEERKEIPIFYVPIHPQDRSKRDCLSWSILYGALTAYHISTRISKWLTPKRYYVSFPYSVYCPHTLRQHRKKISSDKGFFLSYNNKTVKDGEYLGFTFNEEEFIRYRKVIRSGTGLYYPNKDGGIPTDMLPKEERWSARFFELGDVFKTADVEGSIVVDLDWFYNIETWENYSEFMSSEYKLKRPSKHVLLYREFNPIGVDNDSVLC